MIAREGNRPAAWSPPSRQGQGSWFQSGRDWRFKRRARLRQDTGALAARAMKMRGKLRMRCVDAFNHFLRKSYFEKMLEVAERAPLQALQHGT
jgi:hypothetical protein